jgi:hypothetical protein
MSWTAEVSNVNQQVQLGVESTSALGTAVAATKLLKCFNWILGVDAGVSFFGSTGHKYEEAQEEDFEQTSIDIAGDMDFNGIIYLLASAMGSASAATHGSSATAKDWVFTPPITGSVVPQTYTIQQGDSVRARSFSYGLLNSFGYKGTRKTPFTVSAKGFGQQMSDGITLTSSPTSVALAPLAGKFFNVWLDTTSAGLGTTLLTRCFSVDYAFDAIYQPFYPINRSNASFTAHVDLKPKTTLKLILEADSTGLNTLQTSYLQTGSTAYVRVQAQGKIIDNSYLVTLGTQSSGTFTLTYGGVTTGTIAYNATSATVQTAVTGLSSVGAGNATVSGSTGGPYTVTFIGTLATSTNALTGTFSSLTTPGNASLTSAVVNNIITHDMACKIGKPSPFKDEQGVYAVEWELTVIEDPAWNSGQAQIVTVTNLITAL